ncbi:MAG: PQQ-dependent sugar dehydrogenase [Actinomycetota bacterium]
MSLPGRRRRTPLVVLALVLVAAACSAGGNGGGDGAGPGTTAEGEAPANGNGPGGEGPGPTEPSEPAGPPEVGRADVRLVRVADVQSPVAMAVRPGDDSIYVAEKTGRVRRVVRGQTADPGGLDSAAVLDLSGQVSTGSEQGLLGLAFSPDGDRLYVNYTDRSGDTQVVEYAFRDGRADTSSRRVVLSVDQPFGNHNGGQVSFGPDGMLYVGLGDGGSGNDPGNRAQNLADLLGSVLRIDPRPSGGAGYTVPPDNPFASGQDGARPEIWMYGLRNPWRFSFDRQSGDLWIGDVGQNAVEEVNFLAGAAPAGTNFGWAQVEGSRRVKGPNPPGAVLPIHEYGHDQGCSVTGGHVYRGSRVPTLRGIYVFGDACSGTIWGLVQSGGEAVDHGVLVSGDDAAVRAPGFSIASFGEDSAGELYVLNLAGSLLRFEPAG